MTIVLVGVWLAALGCADLGRTSVDRPQVRVAVWSLTGGGAVLMVGLLVVDVAWLPRLLLFAALSGLLAGWLLLTSRALALASLIAGLVLSTLSAGVIRADRSWPRWLDDTVLGAVSTSGVVVAAGVLVAQLSTANLLVRLLLDAVGVPATTNEKQLRGGRVLGPMERVLIVCLGALGEVTAASIVVAAKGLLRFPELQRAQRASSPPPDGPSDVTEYFLIGSLASWLLALAGAALVRLSG